MGKQSHVAAGQMSPLVPPPREQKTAFCSRVALREALPTHSASTVTRDFGRNFEAVPFPPPLGYMPMKTDSALRVAAQ